MTVKQCIDLLKQAPDDALVTYTENLSSFTHFKYAVVVKSNYILGEDQTQLVDLVAFKAEGM